MKATAEHPYPRTIEEVLEWFPTEEDCIAYLEWIDGRKGLFVHDARQERLGIRNVDVAKVVVGRVLQQQGRFLRIAANRSDCGFMLCGS